MFPPVPIIEDAPWWANVILILATLVAAVAVAAVGVGGWIKARSQRSVIRERAEAMSREADLKMQEFYRNAITDANRLIADQAQRMTALQGEVADVKREVAAIGDRARRAESEVDRVHSWIEAGMPPPPLERPGWAARFVRPEPLNNHEEQRSNR